MLKYQIRQVFVNRDNEKQVKYHDYIVEDKTQFLSRYQSFLNKYADAHSINGEHTFTYKLVNDNYITPNCPTRKKSKILDKVKRFTKTYGAYYLETDMLQSHWLDGTQSDVEELKEDKTTEEREEFTTPFFFDDYDVLENSNYTCSIMNIKDCDLDILNNLKRVYSSEEKISIVINDASANRQVFTGILHTLLVDISGLVSITLFKDL